jgi:hypothetical protein
MSLIPKLSVSKNENFYETPSLAFMPFRVHLWPNQKSLNLGYIKLREFKL